MRAEGGRYTCIHILTRFRWAECTVAPGQVESYPCAAGEQEAQPLDQDQSERSTFSSGFDTTGGKCPAKLYAEP